MLETERSYPATPYRLKELREKGVFAYSKVGHKALNLAVLFAISCFFLIPERTDLKVNLEAIISFNHVSEIKGIILYFLSLGVKIGLSLFIIALLVGLFQSAFLVLKLGRYEHGNLRQSKFLSKPKDGIIQVVFQITLFLLTLSYIYSIFSSLSNIQDLNELNLKFIEENLNNYLYLLIGSLLFLGTLLIVRQKFDFIQNQRMSKSEVLQEIKETEGSQETKKQIKASR